MGDAEQPTRLSLLAAIVETSEDAIVGMSPDGTILTWNRGAQQMLGYPESEAVGRHVSLLVREEWRDELEGLLYAVARGERVHQRDVAWVTRSGSHLEVAVTLSPVVDAAGVVVGASAIGRDVSEERWIAKTLDEAIAKLEAALAQAQEADSRSRRFLADAAHQLRGPMATIRANTESILEGVGDEDRDRLLRNLVREVARSDRLTTSLLTMARLDQGEGIVRLPCNIVAVCCDEADRTWSLAPNLDIVVQADELPEEPLDERAVREIMANLLDNARRHATDTIRLLISAPEADLEIRVVDDGPGIPSALAGRVFERFVSLDGKGGSGLGLAIARDLARAHGGELSYQGSDGGFVLRLPLGGGVTGSPASAPVE